MCIVELQKEDTPFNDTHDEQEIEIIKLPLILIPYVIDNSMNANIRQIIEDSILQEIIEQDLGNVSMICEIIDDIRNIYLFLNF